MTTETTAEPRPVRRRVSFSLVAGLAMVGVVVVLGLAASLLTSYDPLQQIVGANLLPPSSSHLLGTDELNRDVWSRVLYGIRTTLTVLIISVPIGAVIGIVLGLLSMSNRVLDTISARAFDVILAFPALILAITVTAIRGPGITTVIIAIAITEIPVFGRITRSAALRVAEQPYVESARIVGGSNLWVLRQHILPNSTEPLVVQLALSLSLAVFIESAMSFIGVGVRPPQPSLGSILAEAVYSWDVNAGYALGPLIAIVVLSLGFLLIAQGFGASGFGGRRSA